MDKMTVFVFIVMPLVYFLFSLAQLLCKFSQSENLPAPTGFSRRATSCRSRLRSRRSFHSVGIPTEAKQTSELSPPLADERRRNRFYLVAPTGFEQVFL